MTAIKATFSDFRIVKGRKVAQLVMEVPIEAANNALEALGGVPQPDVAQWVAIARLTEEAATRPAEKPRKRFRDMSRAQQAGILCASDEFCLFCIEQYGAGRIDDFVRRYCQVLSRADIDDSEHSAELWDKLLTEYDAWRGKIAGEDA